MSRVEYGWEGAGRDIDMKGRLRSQSDACQNLLQSHLN